MMHILTPERYCDEQVITFPKVNGAMPDLPVGTWVRPSMMTGNAPLSNFSNWDVYEPIKSASDVSLLCAPIILKTMRPDSGGTAIPGVANPEFAFTGQVEKAVILRNWDDKIVITDQIVNADTLVSGDLLTLDATGKLTKATAGKPIFGIFHGRNVTRYGDGTTGYVVKLKAQAVMPA